MTSTRKPLTVLFIPLDGYGHINACIGVAERLFSRGHRVIFALERAWKGKASRYAGIEEVHFVDHTRDPSLGANEHWINYMEEFKKTFPLEPVEINHFKAANSELEEQFLYTLINVDAELVAIIDQVKPDVIVADTYVTIPAVYKSGIPWVWLTSAAPLVCLPSDDLPPHGTGYPTNGDKSEWEEFRRLENAWLAPIGARFNERLVREFGIPALQDGVMHPSPYLNMYAYPEELDYLEIRPLPEKWCRFDHFIRLTESDPNFKIPEDFLKKQLGKIVYLSLGSMGCADIDLMNRLIEILSKSPNRFIFSLGPYGDKLKLAANMWGAEFVPQTNVLPLVSLVISHGGNNTVIESLYFGKPILVTPLFGDQRDNAQRITELGLGDRVNPYKCSAEEMLDKVDKLLKDEVMQSKIRAISKRMQASNSTENAAIAIENVAL